MTDAREDMRDAGLLLRYALDHALAPSRHDTYGLLLDRYHTDPGLRTAFDQVITGLGIRVLAADRTTGIVLAAETDSPLSVTDTKKWLSIGGSGDRMVYGLALGGVAAWCYPNARSVREPGTRRVTAIDVDRLIRDHAAAVEAGESELTEGLGQAWFEYSTNRRQAGKTRSGRLKRNSTVRMCEDVLIMLNDFGFVVVDRTVPSPTTELRVWRSTDRFRAYVAAGGGPLVWQTLAGSGITDQAFLGPTTGRDA